MSDFSDYAEGVVAAWVAGTDDPPPVSAGRWLALFTAASDAEAGEGTEVPTADTAYARIDLAGIVEVIAGQVIPTEAIESEVATGDGFGTVTHAAIVDEAAGACNFLTAIVPLLAPKTINAGDIFRLPAGQPIFEAQ